MEIRTSTISFSKGRAKINRRREISIKNQLDQLDEKICASDDALTLDEELKQYDNLKKELQTLYDVKGEAAKFRSKCLWVEQGERPTKYFFNLEKRNYNKRVISELEDENGKVVDENQILPEIEKYFGNLYSSKITSTEDLLNQFTEGVQLPRLSDGERETIEGLLSFEECKKVVESFKNDKSPGEDGFTSEFYLTFFDLIGNDLVNSLNAGYENGKLSISQRRGVINLIPKDDSALNHLKNWRPITVLNVDYKIASKVIAKRMESFLPRLVHSDQTGFVKDRYIGENIRLISDIMEQTRKNNIPGIFASLDFSKAFDTLEWPCIQHALKLFNFGEGLRRWVTVFYSDIESAALNNGFATNWIKPFTGVRQGCPLSPYLFILTAELMSNKIRQSNEVKGIVMFNMEIKLSQFADDTNLLCSDITSVKNALTILESFGEVSGLKLNIEKTKAMWLGKLVNNKEKPLDLKWVKNPTRTLGIYVSYDSQANDKLNFETKIQKFQTKLDIWRSRDLTLFGKVLISKTLGISSLVYSMSNIDVPKEVIPDVQRRLFKFVWNNKQDKIKRTSLYQDFEKGGLRMPDIETINKALKLAWIPRLLRTGNFNWRTVPEFFFNKHGGLGFFLLCNYRVKDLDHLPLFYKDILLFFNELKVLYNYNNFSDMILFNNKDILIGGKPFLFKEWLNKGIRTIMHLLDINGDFFSFEDFKSKYSLKKTNFLHYYQVTSAISNHLLAKAKNTKLSLGDQANLNFDLANFPLDDNTSIDLFKIKSKQFYWLLINKMYTNSPAGPTRWTKSINPVNSTWKEIFLLGRRSCKENKLREFNFKFIHRIIVTRKELCRFKIKEDDNCIYCGEADSIDHSFINCQFTRSFYQKVLQWFNTTHNSTFSLTTEEFLFGIPTAFTTLLKKINYTIMFLRYYIYKRKIQNDSLLLPDFINKIIYKYKIEKLIL